jgi:hypothetical protein
LDHDLQFSRLKLIDFNEAFVELIGDLLGFLGIVTVDGIAFCATV